MGMKQQNNGQKSEHNLPRSKCYPAIYLWVHYFLLSPHICRPIPRQCISAWERSCSVWECEQGMEFGNNFRIPKVPVHREANLVPRPFLVCGVRTGKRRVGTRPQRGSTAAFLPSALMRENANVEYVRVMNKISYERSGGHVASRVWDKISIHSFAAIYYQTLMQFNRLVKVG